MSADTDILPPDSAHLPDPGELIGWILRDGANLPDAPAFIKALVERLQAADLPLLRFSAYLRTLDPRAIGVTFTWWRGVTEITCFSAPHGVFKIDGFRNSPLKSLFGGTSMVSYALDGRQVLPAYEVFDTLRDAGATDYLGIAGDGSPQTAMAPDRPEGVLTIWVTDQQGGFTDAQRNLISAIVPALRLVFELYSQRLGTIRLLDTYVGHNAGLRVLSGEIVRGSGESITGAVWNSDLRRFTAMSEQMPRDELIEALNCYFEVMGQAVEAYGGEVVKFLGDGMLAVFRADQVSACNAALRAALAARRGMLELNAERLRQGKMPLSYGIALHLGELIWGNVGTLDRLDYTVIGEAVNEVARLQNLASQLSVEIVISQRFARLNPLAVQELGEFCLRGVSKRQKVYTLYGEAL
ncbi:MAG: adenylate/guanylate cyclase domain-containing protein [Geminicoccaceae bacterium]